MPTNETDLLNTPALEASNNYLVVAADMAFYDGHTIKNYNFVMTRAKDDEHALETATSALEDGVLPLVAFSAEDLRQLADELTARPLGLGRSYNVSANMTDLELAGPNEDEP